jgi:YVTN family beta-propeller protein
MTGGGGLEFRVLGPIEVSDDGRDLALGGPKQRALLADLVLNAGSIVSTDRLIDDLWADASPPAASHTVETYIARLRRVLRDGARPEVLLTRAPGYLLDAEPGQVDAFRFQQLVKDGTAAAGRGDHEQASALLGAALALWRGPALADVDGAPFAQAAARRLTDQRLLAQERRIDCDLALGRAQDLIGELDALIGGQPYHEPFHRQLMLALYRSGRQSDALAAFHRARRLLADELGIEPGPDLRRMEQAILRQDPGLEPGQSPAARPPQAAPPQAAPPSRPAGPARVPGRGRHRRRGLIAGGVALAVAVAVAVSLATRTAVARAGVPANGIGVLSPSGNSVTAGLAMPSALGSLAVGGGSVWATSPEGRAVYRIDPAARAITQAIPVGAGADGIAYDDGDVWVANAGDGTVSRIDGTAGQVVQTTGAGSDPTGVASGLGAVWVTDQLGSAVYRIDPASGHLTRTIGLASPPYGIAVGAGSLWVTSPGADTVTRIDPVAGQSVQTIPVGAAPAAITVGFGSVWVANKLDSTVSRINPHTGAVTETIPVGNGPTALAVASTGVWVAGASGAVARIDPAAGRVVSSLRVGEPAVAAAVIKGVPWVGTGAGYPRRHRGGTLRVLSSAWPGPPGSAANYFALPPQFAAATYDTLVTFQQVGGSGGVQLVPDLALAIPASQAGGTQYTFVLRPGLRYSNGAAVQPRDFRYALERVLEANPYQRSFFTALVGAGACHSGSPCNLSRAITVDDHARTVTFHLTAPDANFLYKLASPSTAPVPASLPAHPARSSPVPGTGPYMITRVLRGREIDLARNPYFRQWSAAAQPAGFPDRIVWRFGLTPAQEVAAIEAGRADWMADPPPDVASLLARYDRQVHINPVPGISYAAFNVTVPPFNNLKVRQALSLAANRNQAVTAQGGPDAAQPACQIIPPGLPGYRPYCPYTVDPGPGGTWTGPDLVRARRLVAASHTTGMRVVVWAHQWDGPLGPYFVRLLSELGYRASLRVASVAAFARNVNDTRRRAQASVGTWVADYPSASDFFDQFFRCSAFRPADPADTHSGSFFCHPAIDRLMNQADQLQASDPRAAARVWAQVDHEITDLAPWVPFATLRSADFTSARTGDYQYNPARGILLDQLWVR